MIRRRILIDTGSGLHLSADSVSVDAKAGNGTIILLDRNGNAYTGATVSVSKTSKFTSASYNSSTGVISYTYSRNTNTSNSVTGYLTIVCEGISMQFDLIQSADYAVSSELVLQVDLDDWDLTWTNLPIEEITSGPHKRTTPPSNYGATLSHSKMTGSVDVSAVERTKTTYYSGNESISATGTVVYHYIGPPEFYCDGVVTDPYFIFDWEDYGQYRFLTLQSSQTRIGTPYGYLTIPSGDYAGSHFPQARCPLLR